MVSVSDDLLCGMIFAKGGRVSSDVLREQDRSGNDRKSGAGEVGRIGRESVSMPKIKTVIKVKCPRKSMLKPVGFMMHIRQWMICLW